MSHEHSERVEDSVQRPWAAPTMIVYDIDEVTEGDPTISDDGLGDGLFS